MKIAAINFLSLLCASNCFGQGDKLYAELLEDYAEASSYYYGLCFTIEHLKASNCPAIAIPTRFASSYCRSEVISLSPDFAKTTLDQLLQQYLSELQSLAVSSIREGYGKVLEMTGGDAEKACLGYSSAALATTEAASEQLQYISQKLKSITNP